MNSLIGFAAALASGALAVAVLVRRRNSVASWCFFAGMTVLAISALMESLGMRATDPAEALRWETLALASRSLIPGVWLCFSLTYSRGNHREFLSKWRIPIAVAFILPPALVL